VPLNLHVAETVQRNIRRPSKARAHSLSLSLTLCFSPVPFSIFSRKMLDHARTLAEFALTSRGNERHAIIHTEGNNRITKLLQFRCAAACATAMDFHINCASNSRNEFFTWPNASVTGALHCRILDRARDFILWRTSAPARTSEYFYAELFHLALYITDFMYDNIKRSPTRWKGP